MGQHSGMVAVLKEQYEAQANRIADLAAEALPPEILNCACRIWSASFLSALSASFL